MKSLIEYITKKYHQYIIDCYKSKQCYGWLYSAVLEWPDGFCRLVDEENIADFKWKIKTLIEVNRELEF